MRKAALLLIAILYSWPAAAADLGVPALSTPLFSNRFLDPDRFLTTGGVFFSGTSDFTLEPELGMSHRAKERDLPGGLTESIHEVHAQAGWRFSLPQSLHLSAAAKLPVFTYESTGRSIGQDFSPKKDYDFGHPLKTGVTWTGEVGVYLSSSTELTLYYDQGLIHGVVPGAVQQDDRIGTRIILRFK